MKRPPADPVPWTPPDEADGEGLVGIGGDLDPAILLRAYADGVFPWFNEGDPILWWSPDPRAVIELDGLHVSKSLARTMRKGLFRVTLDRRFETVMRQCGERRDEGTWVTEAMVKSYAELHRLGHAHSLETWVPLEYAIASGRLQQIETLSDDTGIWALAGGVYGVAIGGLFAAESMFHYITDGSKVALASLVNHLQQRGYTLFDVQMTTDHTLSMGAKEISRKSYLRRLRAATANRSIAYTATPG